MTTSPPNNDVYYSSHGISCGELVAVLANLMGAVNEADHREASIITFLATASGISLLGLSSAFWGVILGGVSYVVLHRRPAAKPAIAIPAAERAAP